MAMREMAQARNTSDVVKMTSYVKLIVEFSKGFQTRVAKQEVRQCFE
jgi:hypothetical protein